MFRAALLFLYFFSFVFQAKAQVFEEYLLSGWTIEPGPAARKLPAEVPGSVQYNLALNGRELAEPMNDRWIYTHTFQADQQILARAFVNLVFEGLDSRADIYLNGRQILQTDNMFRVWLVPVKSFLKEGDNTLRIEFLQTKADSLRVRKARYHFDRPPAEVPLGIWKPVILQSYNTFHFRDFSLVQDSLRGRTAHLHALVQLHGVPGTPLQVEVYDEISGKTYARQELHLTDSTQVSRVPFEIGRAALWWPKGMGEQALYQIGVRVSAGKSEEQNRIKRTGIRELAWKDGQVTVGERAVDLVSSQYIPEVLEVSARRSAEFDQLFDSLDARGVNLIHVEAAGIYESDYFYDLADVRGFLIVHDLMFDSNLPYPADENFLVNAGSEVCQEMRRVNHHPSVLAWRAAGLKESAPALFDRIRKEVEKNKAILISQDGLSINYH